MSDAMTATAIGVGGTILRTTDGGITWNIQKANIGTTNNLYSVSFTGRDTGTIVGQMTGNVIDGFILHTTDGGTTWNTEVSGVTSGLLGVIQMDGKTAVAVGGFGEILRTNDGGLAGVTKPYFVTNPMDDGLLEQNYPNPVAKKTSIGFVIEKAGPVSIEVFDALSNRVAVLVNEPMTPGSYTATFEPKDLPNGIYYYRISIAGNSRSKKFLIMQ
jgi:hypothetical protein